MAETAQEALASVRDALWRMSTEARGKHVEIRKTTGIEQCHHCQARLEALGEKIDRTIKGLPHQVLNTPVDD